MIGIENFLNNPLMITLATAWFLKGRMKFSNLKSNLEEMKNDFIIFANNMGYSIDKDVLDYRFKELIENIKKILSKGK